MPPPTTTKASKAIVPETFIALVAHFLDFLTVSIHTILYERNIYPRDSFSPARRYNYPVRHSRVPEVRAWVNAAIDALEEELLQGHVERVSLVVYSRFGDPLERFVFDLARFPVVAKRDWHVPFASTAPERAAEERARLRHEVRVGDLEQQFRAVMARLQFCQRELEPLPEDVTWTIAVEVKEDAPAPGPIDSKFSPWIVVEPSLQHERSRDGQPGKIGADVGGVRTTPIRNVEAGELLFEIWVEEAASKIDALDRERFADEYERDEEVPGFHVEPKIEVERKKGKGKAKADSDDDSDVKDEFDDMVDDLDDMSQYSFMAGDKG